MAYFKMSKIGRDRNDIFAKFISVVPPLGKVDLELKKSCYKRIFVQSLTANITS